MDNSVYDIFTRIPTLETERLVLRKLSVKDAEDMYEYSKRKEVPEFLLWLPHQSIHITRNHLRYLQGQYLKRSCYDWAITLRQTGKMIGTCGFSHIDAENNAAEIGYVLSSDYWGRGYATEAVCRVTEFGFETCGFNRIYARILEGNYASVRVAQKNGMRHEATYRRALLVKGEYKTYHEYAILSDEFYSTHP